MSCKDPWFANALIAEGCDIFRRDKEGKTYLHKVAAMPNGSELIKQLTLKGVNIEATDSNGCSALHYATIFSQVENLKAILTLIPRHEKFSFINKQDNKFGWTALHYAAVAGSLTISQILLDHG